MHFSENRPLVAIVGVITAALIIYGMVSLTKRSRPREFGNEFAPVRQAEVRQASKAQNDGNTQRPFYSDVASMKIANFTPPKKLEAAYEFLRRGEHDKAILELNAISRESATTPEEKDMIEFTKAQIYFTNRNFVEARTMFERFLKENPNHPLAENAQKSIEYIDNYDKFKNDYKKFEDEIKKIYH